MSAETFAPEYDTLTTALRIAYGEDTTTTPTREHLTAMAGAVRDARGIQRRETEMLDWLLRQGYVAELRRYGDGQWGFETDDGKVIGATARKAIKQAMEVDA